MNNVGERLEQLLKSLGVNAKQFAQIIGEKEAKISAYKNNLYYPGSKTLINIMLKYKNLNINWFLLGEGEMWKQDNLIAQDNSPNQYNVNKPPDRPPCDEPEKTLLTKDEQVSMLIMQNDKLINIVEKHTATIYNLTTPIQLEVPKAETKLGGSVPKNVQG
ncbi:MAG: helix-turn-helix domain-containing protein [Bacteroidales bacterium]